MIRGLLRFAAGNLFIVACLGIALAASVGSYRELHRHKRIAAEIPLANRTHVATAFTTDLPGKYLVQVDMKHNYPKDRPFYDSPPTVTCSVMGRDAVRVDRMDWQNYSNRESFGLVIAEIGAKPNQPYDIACEVKFKDVTFDRLEPRLQVCAAPETYRKARIYSKLLSLLSLASLGIAAVSLVGKWRRSL